MASRMLQWPLNGPSFDKQGAVGGLLRLSLGIRVAASNLFDNTWPLWSSMNEL